MDWEQYYHPKDRGPLDDHQHTRDDGQDEYIKAMRILAEKMAGVNNGILEVEQHIIDRLKAEAGASNIKLLAEALEIITEIKTKGGKACRD